MNHTKHRNAFTMIELLIVIVVLGIVGGIALEAIRQYYEGIYRTQEYSKRVAEADRMLEQISKYFENAISASIVVTEQDAGTMCIGAPPAIDDGHDYTIAFIKVDSEGLEGYWDSMLGRWKPAWNAHGTNVGVNYFSPDSNFTAINAMQAIQNEAAIYRSENDSLNDICSRHNWDGGIAEDDTVFRTIQNHISDFNVTLSGILSTSGNVNKGYVLRSAYAFRANYNGDFNMYSNFQPWNDEDKDDGKISLIGKNVAHFTILHDEQNTTVNSNIGMVYTLKLCMKGLTSDLNTTEDRENQICRERMIRVRY